MPFTAACATADGGDPFGTPVDDLGAGKDAAPVGDDATGGVEHDEPITCVHHGASQPLSAWRGRAGCRR